MGDSNAEMLVPAFEAMARANGFTLSLAVTRATPRTDEGTNSIAAGSKYEPHRAAELHDFRLQLTPPTGSQDRQRYGFPSRATRARDATLARVPRHACGTAASKPLWPITQPDSTTERVAAPTTLDSLINAVSDNSSSTHHGIFKSFRRSSGGSSEVSW
jgi:hypothetical protein